MWDALKPALKPLICGTVAHASKSASKLASGFTTLAETYQTHLKSVIPGNGVEKLAAVAFASATARVPLRRSAHSCA